MFCPELFGMFSQIHDPRNASYVLYEMRAIMGTLYFKNLLGIVTMRSMTEMFGDEKIPYNIYQCMGMENDGPLPHYQTINDLLCRVDPDEVEKILQEIVYRLIRRKSFDKAKFRKKWMILVDATETYSGKVKLNDHCLERRHKKGTPEETVSYYLSVLEAKIYLGGDLVVSICSEFIENNSEDYKRQKSLSIEAIKQDCETKAFKRLAKKLKKQFPRLPICILADSLYASEPVMNICKENEWDYILRYKGGSIPTIEEEFERIPERGETSYRDEAKGKNGTITFVNDIEYRKYAINMLRCLEVDKKGQERQFQFLTTFRIGTRNAQKISENGRCRWKIENQGFKRQKKEAQDITHMCSWNEQAEKIHYLMAQIADLFRKLYELFYLEKHDIKKTQRKISSDLLTSLYQPFTETEDTS